MQFVKIHIPNRRQSAKALVELSGYGRIDCYENDVYMVPEPGLQLLGELEIDYRELGRGGLDYAIKSLRDTQDEYARRPAAGTRPEG
jgi:hypothetical protein